MYVGNGEFVDASSRPAENGEQRPIRHLRLDKQFPLPRDKGAADIVTANRSLVALRHSGLTLDLGNRAAEIAKQVARDQRIGPDDDTWKFRPNDLLVRTPLVLRRSFETANKQSPFVNQNPDIADLIQALLVLLTAVFNPHETDYRSGVTCSELVHRILRKLRLPLTPDDGRPALSEYAPVVRELLAVHAYDVRGRRLSPAPRVARLRRTSRAAS